MRCRGVPKAETRKPRKAGGAANVQRKARARRILKARGEVLLSNTCLTLTSWGCPRAGAGVHWLRQKAESKRAERALTTPAVRVHAPYSARMPHAWRHAKHLLGTMSCALTSNRPRRTEAGLGAGHVRYGTRLQRNFESGATIRSPVTTAAERQGTGADRSRGAASRQSQILSPWCQSLPVQKKSKMDKGQCRQRQRR